MKMENLNYAIISPCRNEADFMQKTLDSVLIQTVKPSLWVIVDDGSTDESYNILMEYSEKHSLIKVIKRENRGYRSVGPGVIETFYLGYESIDADQFDFVCKLDLDLILPPRYFEILMERMKENSRLGTCSGKPYYTDPKTGEFISEYIGDENSIGASKFYRTQCFKEIGGFTKQVMWDGIDGHRCRMLGWIACSWDEPDLRFHHLRPMGSSQKNILAGRIRHGFGQYFMGTGLLYMSISAIYRMSRPPYIIGGLAMWWGYVHSWLTRKERYNDADFRKFLRKYQWSCLTLGKSKATLKINNEQEQVWNP